MGVSSFGAGGQPESRSGSQPDLPSTVQDAPELGCTGWESARIPQPYSPSDGSKHARRTSNGHHPNRQGRGLGVVCPRSRPCTSAWEPRFATNAACGTGTRRRCETGQPMQPSWHRESRFAIGCRGVPADFGKNRCSWRSVKQANSASGTVSFYKTGGGSGAYSWRHVAIPAVRRRGQGLAGRRTRLPSPCRINACRKAPLATVRLGA